PRHGEVTTALRDGGPASRSRSGRPDRPRIEWNNRMNPGRTVDERIRAWLEAEAPDQLPDVVLQVAFDRSRATRQRRSIAGWRDIFVNARLLAIAGGAAAIVILAAGALWVGVFSPANVGHPTAVPSQTPTPAPTHALLPT